MTRVARWFAPALLALIVVLVAAAFPAVRAQLRESFTRLPADYTELYFGADPTLTGSGAAASVSVPVALRHHGASTESFRVEATVTVPGDHSGAGAATTVTGPPETVASTVFAIRIPRRATAYLIDVALPGHPQTLHYELKLKDAP